MVGVMRLPAADEKVPEDVPLGCFFIDFFVPAEDVADLFLEMGANKFSLELLVVPSEEADNVVTVASSCLSPMAALLRG